MTIVMHFLSGSGRFYGRGNLGSEKPLEDLSRSFSSFILVRAICRERFSANTWFIWCLICLRSSFSSSRSFFIKSNSLSSEIINEYISLYAAAVRNEAHYDDDDDDYLTQFIFYYCHHHSHYQATPLTSLSLQEQRKT